jgi:type IX secretion system substrate protein/cohesin domain-containing protein
MRLAYTRLPLIILAFLCMNSYTSFAAEPVFNFNGGSVCKDATVEVDVTLADFTDMISFQFTVGWDKTVLQIDEVTYINPVITDIVFGDIGNENEVLTLSWFDNDITGKSIADDEVLFTLLFNVVGDNSTVSMLTFQDDPTPREVITMDNGDFTSVDGIWNDDVIIVAQPELAQVEVTDDVNMGNVGAVNITMTNGTAPYTYVWDNGQTTEDLANVPVGTYNCTVTDAKNCVTEVGPFTVDNTLGANEIEGLINIQLYPNPTNGKINLIAQLENSQEMELNIFNILGNKVYFEQIESANIELDLDLSDLPIGNYIVQLRTIDGMHVQKMQIHR